ncbi:MAG: hypothetical protein KJN72_13270 [Woeseia sp.]|nr:hypothetical protein [Woeseia sp.]
MGRATARAPLEKIPALNVPLFQSILEQREDTQRQVILDLGAASSAMLSVLGQFPCHVQIADLASDGGIERLNAAETGDEIAELAAVLLPPHSAEDPVDLVLCWDLPNYIKPAAMSALMAAVEARALPGATAHALVVYSESSMPDRPRRYIPMNDGRLVNHATATAEIPAPRYSAEALGQMMGRFEIDRARLLANGMQEFLLCLQR